DPRRLARRGGGPSVSGWSLSRSGSTSPPLHLRSEVAYRLFGNRPPLATGQRGLRPIDGSENFGAASLGLLPEAERLLHGVLGPGEAARLDGVPNQGLLVRGQMDVHGLSVGVAAR